MLAAPTIFAAAPASAPPQALPEGPLAPAQVPEPLKPWIGWALRGREELLCPSAQVASGEEAQARSCRWPARLQLELDAHGGKFSQGVRVYRDMLVELPGGKASWPQEVKVDGQPAPVLDEDGAPSVWLRAGEHALSGNFLWPKLPESLPVSKLTGLVSLKLRGAQVAFPSRGADGLLWLQREHEDEKGESTLAVRVWREVIDEVPLRVVTRLSLEVSGKDREVLLGKALLDGFIPLSLESELPARLEPDGRLRVQLRPGTFGVELTARHRGPVAALALAPKEKNFADADSAWADEELWVFAARPDLRVVEVVGVPSIDPAQTTLPPEWRSLPAYRMRPGDTMKLNQERRGDADPAPDQLDLSRLIWLDFDGRGLTSRDSLSGTLTRSDRLEMPEPAELGRVRAQGIDQLITRLTPTSAPGVELRQGTLALDAESRADFKGGTLAAVGWSHAVRSLQAQLVLPPGFRLLHASGADEISPTWLQSWSLLDLFLLLLAALAAGKLFGWKLGLAMLLGLGLSLPEGAPKWLWLLPLALEALSRAVPAGRVQQGLRIARGAALLLLLLLLAPFAVHHLRAGLHPALERGYETPALNFFSSAEDAKAERPAELAFAAPPAPPPPVVHGAVAGALAGGAGQGNALGIGGLGTRSNQLGGRGKDDEGKFGKKGSFGGDLAGHGRDANEYQPDRMKIVSGSTLLSSDPAAEYQQTLDLARIDPDAIAQTGPGLPEWSWNSVSLRWNGPVEAGARVRLWLLPPWMNLLLAFLRVFLLALLWLKLLAPGAGGLRALLARIPQRAGATAALLFVLAAPAARAGDLPSKELLDELGARLTAANGCDRNCLSSPRMSVEASGASLRLRVQLDAAAEVAAPLPGALGQWSPDTVLLDGKPAAALARSDDGTLWIALAPGTHQLVLEGALPARDEVELALPQRPKAVEARLSGWTLDGVHDDGTPEETLRLARIERGEKKNERLEPGQLPPFVEVERALILGMTWQVSTRVRRLSPAGAPITLAIPLLPGESITSADVRAQAGTARVALGPRSDEVAWTSTLEQAPKLKLTAADDPGFAETWRLEVAPTWHVESAGVPPIHQAIAAQRVPAYRPWPGESLELTISRPKPATGATLTIQSSDLTVTPGARTTDAQLALKLSTSRGGPTSLELPEGAELQSLSLDGASLPVHQDGRAVTLALSPGEHRAQLDWREPRGLSALYKTPRANLNVASVNSAIQLRLPSRWVLFIGGPRLGPAVLLWSFVLVMLLCAFALARFGSTPLKTHQWLLLALGLTQVDAVAAACVAGWFLALGWRRAAAGRIPGVKRFDLVQIALVAWTLCAGAALVGAIQLGLLGEPQMQVSGNGSTASVLNWFVDRSGPELPAAWVLSLPILVYRLAMLAWALWLALAMVRWLPWAWASFSAGGLWRARRKEARSAEPARAEAKPEPGPAPAG